MTLRAQRADIHIVEHFAFMLIVALAPQGNIAIHKLIIFGEKFARPAHGLSLIGKLPKPRIRQPCFGQMIIVNLNRRRHGQTRQPVINGFLANKKTSAQNQLIVGAQIIPHTQARHICVINFGQLGNRVAPQNNMGQRPIITRTDIKPHRVSKLAFAQGIIHGQHIVNLHHQLAGD